MENQENAGVEVVETVVTERQTFHANLNRFDEELYLTMKPTEKCGYLTTLINHSDKYESFWNLSLPIDSDPAISNEILSSFVVYADDKSNKPLDLYKAYCCKPLYIDDIIAYFNSSFIVDIYRKVANSFKLSYRHDESCVLYSTE